MKRSWFLVVCAACAALAGGCGEDSGTPNGNEITDAHTAEIAANAACGERPALAVAALNHAGYGTTSGFLVLCTPLRAVAVDREGGDPGGEERRDVEQFNRHVQRVCGERGARSVSALDHAGYGTTSGLLLACRNGRYAAIDR